MFTAAFRRMSLMGICVLALLEAGCGGGGGGSGSSPNASSPGGNLPLPPPPAKLVVAPSQVSVSAAINAAKPDSVAIEVNLENFPKDAEYIAFGHTTDGIDGVFFEWISQTSARVTISFLSPISARVGEHSAYVVFTGCADEGCTNEIVGTRTVIPVSYVVTDQLPGKEAKVTFANQSLALEGHTHSLSGVPTPATNLDVSMAFTNLGEAPYLGVTASNEALSAAIITQRDAGAGTVSLAVRSALDLGLGSFHDTISITVCLDMDCNYPVAGSPFTVTFDYIISNSGAVEGEYGYGWTITDIQPTSIAWDSVSRHIIATTNVAGASKLIGIDPNTGNVGWGTDLSGAAGRLAVSSDGQFAYVDVVEGGVHQIQKIRLSDQALVRTLGLPADDMTIASLRIAPSDANTLAVVTTSDSGYAVLLYNASALVDRYDIPTTGYSGAVTGSWGADASSYYAYNARTDELMQFSVAGSGLGVSLVRTVDLNGIFEGWSDIRYDGGLLFENHGGIYDAAAHAMIGTNELRTLPTGVLPYSASVAPDANLGRAFYWYLNSSAMTLQSFDLATHRPLANIDLHSNTTFDLIRWGADGLAFVTSTDADRLALIHGRFVAE